MAKKQPEKARRWFPRWTAAGWGAFAAVLSVVVAAVGLFISAREVFPQRHWPHDNSNEPSRPKLDVEQLDDRLGCF
jgi:hypothetical protein